MESRICHNGKCPESSLELSIELWMMLGELMDSDGFVIIWMSFVSFHMVIYQPLPIQKISPIICLWKLCFYKFMSTSDASCTDPSFANLAQMSACFAAYAASPSPPSVSSAIPCNHCTHSVSLCRK
jgi:hypothetical protein